MSIRGLPWQSLEVPFTNGLDQKRGDLFRAPPTLDICKDVEFDDVGELRLRKPYAVKTGTDAAGSAPRKVVAYGDELLIFTEDTLYTYNTADRELISRGTHLAVKVSEATRFASPADQVQCDRAELNGVVFISWTETVSNGGSTVNAGMVAAFDKGTGAVLYGPAGIGSGGSVATGVRLRLVALSTRVLLFYIAAGGLLVYALDPGDPASAFAGSPTTVGALTAFDLYYDATRIPGADTAIVAGRRQTTTSYTIGTVTAGAVASTTTKARTCDGPIAVSCHPSGTHVQVIRANSTNIQGDYILISGMSDVTTGQAIGTVASTPVNQIAAAHRTVQTSSQYRCYAFWDSDESDSGSQQQSDGFCTKFNYVDTGGTIGSQSVFVAGLGVGSRAFDHDGSVYVHLTFEGQSILDVVAGSSSSGSLRAQIQNTYFLYRDDQHLAGKIAAATGGGYSNLVGHLPGVQSLGSNQYGWCAVERRRIPIGSATEYDGYAARAPREVVLEFDSNEARRCARLGQTLYVSGSEIKQYDGVALNEVGFHLQPWTVSVTQGTSATGPADGTYSFKATYRWDNAQGERDRSSSFITAGVQLTGGPDEVNVAVLAPLRPTHKAGVAVEVWRTAVNPPFDAPLYLTTSQDPSVTSNPNRYLPNPATTDTGFTAVLHDALEDDDLVSKENFPESGDVLEALCPPAGTILIASDTRLFLAGVAGDPDRVWYSKQRSDGEVAAFNDALVIPVPRAGGAITSLALLNETLIAFRESAIYALPGDGFDNVGGGTNYGPPRILSTDLGAVSHESVALAPMGLVFKSSKGWYLLDRGFALQYIGGPVRDYDSEDVTSVVVIEAQHQVRITSMERMLVFDYLVGQWSEWSIDFAASACVWRGVYGYLFADGDGYFEEQSTYDAVSYGYDVETTWIKPGGSQGDVRVRWFHLLGEYLSTHHIRIRVARDYEQDGSGNPAYFDDAYWTPTPTTVGGGLQVRHAPSRQNLTAIKVRLTAVSPLNHANPPSSGQLAKLAALSFEFGLKRPLNRRLPSAQRQ